MSDWDPGIRVVSSPLVPEGQYYLVSGVVDPFGFENLFREVPTEPRWEAVQIVHEGMADVLDWLRAAGHHIPTWQEQRDGAGRRWRSQAEIEARLSLLVTNPRRSTIIRL